MDILVDSKPNHGQDKIKDEEQLVSECEQYLSAQELAEKATQLKTDKLQREEGEAMTHSNLHLDCESRDSDCNLKQGSQLSLPLSSGSDYGDARRKRNFMDRCVNKVRSFIKK